MTSQASPGLRYSAHWIGIFFVAWLLGSIGAAIIAPLGLAVPEDVLWSLMIPFGALIAALGASWTAEIITPAPVHNQLLPVVALTEGIAAAIVLVNLVLNWETVFWFPNLISFLVAMMAIVALGASYAAIRFQSSTRSLRRDLLLTLGLLAVGIIVVTAGVAITCSVTRCIA